MLYKDNFKSLKSRPCSHYTLYRIAFRIVSKKLSDVEIIKNKDGFSEIALKISLSLKVFKSYGHVYIIQDSFSNRSKAAISRFIVWAWSKNERKQTQDHLPSKHFFYKKIRSKKKLLQFKREHYIILEETRLKSLRLKATRENKYKS